MNLQAEICKVLVLYRILYFFLKGVPFLLESGNALFFIYVEQTVEVVPCWRSFSLLKKEEF